MVVQAEIARRTTSSKRMFDVLVASALLVLALPLTLVFALAVWVLLQAPPFFTQTRIGRDGQPFRFMKIRTLPLTAPAYADKYAIGEVRTPPFCRFLRSTHLDELPQLLLVLRGEMSLVGPRPEMPHLHEQFGASQRMARERLLPGCAGIWQASVDNDRLIFEAPEYDLFYADHASWRLDLWVLWRTAALMLGGRRVSIDDVPAWARSSRGLDHRDDGLDPALAA